MRLNRLTQRNRVAGFAQKVATVTQLFGGSEQLADYNKDRSYSHMIARL